MDVTSSRSALRTEKYRSESEIVQELLDAMPDGIIELGPDGRISRANLAQSRMYRFNSPDDLIGLCPTALVAPSSRKYSELVLQRRLEGHFVPAVQYRLLRKDGTEFLGETLATTKRDAEGHLLGYLCVTRDITEHERSEVALIASEAKFESLFLSAPVPMALNEILDVNEAWCRLTGFNRSDLIGQRAVDLGLMKLDYFDEIQSLIKAKGSLHNLTISMTGKDDKKIIGLLHCDVVPFGDRECRLSIVQDITEKIRDEEEKALLQRQVQHLQRLESLGRLAGGIAHDINNILCGVMLVAEGMEGRASGNVQEANLITQACCRGRDLVKGLLNFSRKDVHDAGLLDLNQIVIREADLLARTSLQKIAVVQDLETNLALVYGDEGALANALMNLCVNAMDAMPDGGRLTIRTRNEPQGRVSLAVEDTGQGMTEAVRLRALEPFFTTKPLGKGTGLGLAMVFGTAQAHGGSLELQSELGNGTTVVLTVPSNLDAHSTGPDPQLALDPQSLPSCRILMVDDEALIRASVPPLLRALGHRVDVTASGLEALRIFAEDPAFDLVIIDLNMPGLDGESTLWRIRRVRPEIPVLVVSGHVDPLTQARLMAVPNLAFVNKPFRTMELQVAMARLLRSREG